MCENIKKVKPFLAQQLIYSIKDKTTFIIVFVCMIAFNKTQQQQQIDEAVKKKSDCIYYNLFYFNKLNYFIYKHVKGFYLDIYQRRQTDVSFPPHKNRELFAK